MENLLQCKNILASLGLMTRHNPYFSGKPLAMIILFLTIVNLLCHNPYFSGKPLAMMNRMTITGKESCHNPYFSGKPLAINWMIHFLL